MERFPHTKDSFWEPSLDITLQKERSKAWSDGCLSHTVNAATLFHKCLHWVEVCMHVQRALISTLIVNTSQNFRRPLLILSLFLKYFILILNRLYLPTIHWHHTKCLRSQTWSTWPTCALPLRYTPSPFDGRRWTTFLTVHCRGLFLSLFVLFKCGAFYASIVNTLLSIWSHSKVSHSRVTLGFPDE